MQTEEETKVFKKSNGMDCLLLKYGNHIYPGLLVAITGSDIEVLVMDKAGSH